ncbi:serine/threonine-protein kinase [Acidicapsa acidisoli]|uniref:serine/threonine-protein kinase n=1 Tax=Acidicapsa acidisoli TaxID=1615681 RepID=UPI0021DFA274|nr:serine/threonine-protein kinase [Acidicapsa acidisoli]
MDEARWQAVQEIFSSAVDLPEEEQSSALRAMCGDDQTLLTDVMELLQEDRRGQPLLDAGLDQAARSVLDFGPLPSLIKKQIGPYRLLRLLGEGGMGVVYLAERTDIGGQVAIKLLRDAWLSPMRRQRFRIEQLTLAQLNHPSIARIYNSGTLEDGTPWFVMEYAEGLPLTEYWNEYRRKQNGTVRDCLRIFGRVCAAVQYAHSHAIIHRDLKPSNILVNNSGEVKLLDFGIAKQLNSDDSQDHPTITGLRLMTLAYAAPEQLAGDAVGVYTDVYALGVLLYELLTGRLPHRVHEGDTPAADPVTEKPSVLIRRETPERRAQLSPAERADLDILATKALEPEIERRYATVDALIRDVNALLEGRPLEARPAKWSYTVGKFMRRNRRRLVALAATLVVIAGTIVFYTVRLTRARNAALREAARTLRIQQFTESLFDGGDKAAGPALELRAVELLDRGRHEAESLGGDPEMQADMQATLGDIYQKLGKLDQAEPLLNAALQERTKALGSSDRKVAESKVALGLLRKEQGRLDEAEQLVRSGMSTLQKVDSASGVAYARALVALGSVLETRGKYDEAKDILEAALKLQPSNAEATADTAENLAELANAHFYKGAYDLSESYNRQAFDIYRRLYGEEHPAVAQILNNLGAIETNRGNYVASERYYRHALTITEAWYGADHPETAANLTAIAQQLSYEKRDAEAMVLLQRALVIQKHVNGGMSATVASTLNQLGMVAFDAKQYDAARSYFTQAMDHWRATVGDQHPFIAIAYSNIGSVCLDQKDNACAEKNYREAVRRLDASSKDSVNAVIAHLKLGRSLLRQNRFKDAESETLPAYQYLVKHVAADNGFLRASRKDLAAIYDGLHRVDQAARYRAELKAFPI